MAQAGGRGRQVQVACVAIVLLVVASFFAAPPSGAEARPAPPPEETVFAHIDGSTVGAARVLRVAEKISADPDGEPAESDAVEPEPDDDSGGKVIHLTFDDGPRATYTAKILDLLDEYDAKATFFQVGEQATARPELTRAVVARGHALGSHAWNHRDLRKLSPRRLKRQITRTSAVLSRITGRPITCIRPPYGAVNARVTSPIRRKELAMMMWDIDPRDWKRPGAAAIARRVVSKAHPGAVALMHDGGGKRSQTVRALERILRTLSKKGYSFKTLPEC